MKRSWFGWSLVCLVVATACGSSGEGDDMTDSSDLGGAKTDGSGGKTDGKGSGGTGSGGAANDGAASGGKAAGGSGGKDGSGGSGEDVPADAAAFCAAFAGSLCTWAERCRGFEACEDWPALAVATRECEDALASQEAGFVTYSPDAAAVCLKSITTSSCDGPPPIASPLWAAACLGVFPGTVAVGDECMSSDAFYVFDECDGGYCVHETGPQGALECLGSCNAFTQEGQTCDDGNRCALGLYCVDGKCKKGVQFGESCEDTPCAVGLNCVGGPDAYTCRSPGPVGSACNDRYDCLWPAECIDDVCEVDLPEGSVCHHTRSCAEGLYCHGPSQDEQLCTAPIAAGDPCDVNDPCEEGYECSSEEPHVCALPVWSAEGEACGRGCDSGLWCDTSDLKCRVLRGEGGDCPAYDACASQLTCMSDGKCHAPGGLDGPCIADAPSTSCADGLFCDRETQLCKEPRGEGETCHPLAALESCEDGLYCACLGEACEYGGTSEHDPADVCVPQKDIGEACQLNPECASGNCYDGVECVDEPPAAQNCSRAP